LPRTDKTKLEHLETSLMPELLGPFFEGISEYWSKNHRAIVMGRLRPLLGRSVRFEVEDGESLVVRFGERGLDISRNGARGDACVRMSRADWLDVISGRVAIMSVVLAGRCPYPKDQRLPISKASVVLQTIVTMREAAR
jgi:putative sterol carrier protein